MLKIIILVAIYYICSHYILPAITDALLYSFTGHPKESPKSEYNYTDKDYEAEKQYYKQEEEEYTNEAYEDYVEYYEEPKEEPKKEPGLTGIDIIDDLFR
ncbi:MAG: hypothetical protein RR922_04225 [Clostridia bacterium]